MDALVLRQKRAMTEVLTGHGGGQTVCDVAELGSTEATGFIMRNAVQEKFTMDVYQEEGKRSRKRPLGTDATSLLVCTDATVGSTTAKRRGTGEDQG